jgi:YARHG domain
MRFKTLAIVLAMLASTGPAFANCYEDIGCDDSDYFQKSDLKHYSCETLWELRNSIYFQNGYCFETDRAIDFFGNDQCYVDGQGNVHLNKYERKNVATIRSVERSKGCN